MAKVAQRCIMAALDHPRAHKIILVDETDQSAASASLEVPPKALRMFAEILGRMAQGQAISIIPQKMLLSTQEAANYLNVSRPFVVKQLEEKKLNHIKVGRHRRILFEDLIAFQKSMQQKAESALQELVDQAQELDMGY
ncbi:MAG: helix-turn-helix domain-containing protein [Proteobacteria bacterium]|nr:helix-turn-helix domain-containing protein [Pseudomonadota bacterium]